MGYTQLYGICTQVGADAAPQQFQPQQVAGEGEGVDHSKGFRWMTIVLFGESIGKVFERGVGQYPTVGDEVHLVTTKDLKVVYGSDAEEGTVTVGGIAASTGIPARLNLAGLVSRHCAIVGSTGAGKSNLVTVLLEAIAAGGFPSARVLVIDPHGEYASALGSRASVFRVNAVEGQNEHPLWVPFWALPFDELREITLGGLQPEVEAAIRDMVLERKRGAAAQLSNPPPPEALTADSPVPFSVKKLWFDLDDFERRTFEQTDPTDLTLCKLEEKGDPQSLTPNRYPAASPYNTRPYLNKAKRRITRQLELMRCRLRDSNLGFLFNPGDGLSPDLDGKVDTDLDTLVSGWVGHDRPVTVLDVSGSPTEVLPTVVGTMLRVIYDTLFWAADLPIGGRQQPLLVILEEAHRFLPEGGNTPAHRVLATIAKEGRKYGVGLVLVSQRPTELESSVVSQCGTMIALRVTNSLDRARVSAAFPDDLGGLADLLPALRTGEGLFLGEAVFIPSRVRILRATNKPVGDDPKLPKAWRQENRPDSALYSKAITNWRSQSTSAHLANSDHQAVKGD
jgi:DNA helicase HerA-like ATPase